MDVYYYGKHPYFALRLSNSLNWLRNLTKSMQKMAERRQLASQYPRWVKMVSPTSTF